MSRRSWPAAVKNAPEVGPSLACAGAAVALGDLDLGPEGAAQLVLVFLRRRLTPLAGWSRLKQTMAQASSTNANHRPASRSQRTPAAGAYAALSMMVSSPMTRVSQAPKPNSGLDHCAVTSPPPVATARITVVLSDNSACRSGASTGARRFLAERLR
jgi:hypothetical protein